MHRSLPLVLAAAGATTALAQPVTFHRIARGGDPFPGRPGAAYDTFAPFIGPRSLDSNGDIYFQAQTGGSAAEDIMVYRRATGAVEQYVTEGETAGGFPMRLFFGVVGGHQPGVLAHVALLNDGTPGGAFAVVVTGPGGSHTVAARQGDTTPGQATPFTEVGSTSGSYLDVNINSVGMVSYGGRFKDAGGTARYGYYLTRPGAAPERIVDSTMPVPGRPAASWLNSDNIGAPFDGDSPGLDRDGNAFFRAKYRDGGKDYRVFYKRAPDGTITPVADGGSADAIPGVPAGHTYSAFRQAANNQRGDAAFGAQINRPDGTFWGTGVFTRRSGQGVTKVLTSADPVPGIPEAQNTVIGLIAMNEPGHVLTTVNYFLGGLGGQSLVLFNPDGTAEPVLKFDQTPGYPGQRAGITNAAEINSLGDVLFSVRMNLSQENNAAFAYLNDTNTLVPILKTGDVLDGRTVFRFDFGGSFDPQGAIGPAGGPASWDDARNLCMQVTFKDAAGNLTYGIYSVQVPAPGAALLLVLAPFAHRLRRPRP